MFVGSQARLVVGVWHALGGMGNVGRYLRNRRNRNVIVTPVT